MEAVLHKDQHLTHKYRKASNGALGTQALSYNSCRNQAYSKTFLLLAAFFSVFQAHGHALVHGIYAASLLLSGLHESCVDAEECSREKEWRPKHAHAACQCQAGPIICHYCIARDSAAQRVSDNHMILYHTL